MAVPPAIQEAQGVARVTLKAGISNVEVGDLLGYSGGWLQADADAQIPARFVAMQAGKGGDTIAVCAAGVLYDADAPYTAGDVQYLSATAAGHTATIPAASATLTVLQRVGVALDTERMAFDLRSRGPDLLRVQVTYDPASLAATTARNDTVTVTGLKTSDVVRGGSVANNALEAGLVIQEIDVSAADTLRIRLANPTAGAVDGASLTHTLIVERY